MIEQGVRFRMKKLKKDNIQYMLILGFIVLALLIDTFIFQIPRIDNLILNIVFFALFLIAVLLYFIKNLKAIENKAKLRLIMIACQYILAFIIGVFALFPTIDLIISGTMPRLIVKGLSAVFIGFICAKGYTSKLKRE